MHVPPARPAAAGGLRRGGRVVAGPCLTRYPRQARSLTRVLRDRAAEQPRRPWVVFDGDATLTFGDAFDGARAVAAALARDAPPRPRVGLMSRARPEMLVGLHGALLAGGVAVPLNPDLAGAQLDAVLERARLDVVVADPGPLRRLADAGRCPDVAVTTGRGAPGALWSQWLAAPVDLDDVTVPPHDAPAIVLFTSGTTGRPKGVVCSHHYAYAYGALVSDSLRRSPDDVLTTSMPLFHSGGLHVVTHSALHVGCVAHVKSRFSARRWWEEAAADGATQALLLGPMAEMILRTVGEAPPHRVQIASISAFARRDEFAARYRVEVLWQGYGMTEMYPVPMPREMVDGPPDVLGVPSDLYDFAVVDDEDRALGPDEVGELVLRPRDPLLAFSGYLDDPDATDRAWRGGVFHTGDLVSVDERGVLRSHGRRAERIRRRGENVDPADVESVALAYPGVLDAVAYGVPSGLGDDDVKLDVVADARLDLRALHDFVEARLSRHARPRYVEQREVLPRNATRRVERATLAADPLDRPTVLDMGDPPARHA